MRKKKKRHWNEEIRDFIRPALGRKRTLVPGWVGAKPEDQHVFLPTFPDLWNLSPRTACIQMVLHDQYTLAGWKPGNAIFVHMHFRHFLKKITDWFMQRKWRHFKCSVIILTKYVFFTKLRGIASHIMAVKWIYDHSLIEPVVATGVVRVIFRKWCEGLVSFSTHRNCGIMFLQV